MVAKGIQAIRGMHDVLPTDSLYWQHLERCVSDLMSAYAFDQIRMPVLEKTELFKRTIGDVTDIVEKEMYMFEDRNGDSLSLRPEGTAGCVRAVIEHGLIHNQVQKLWYSGPMFRHERPQKGRYRQFHQIGVEVFGLAGPDIDAELIVLTRRLWEKLGLFPYVGLEINTLGTQDERHEYRAALVDFLLTKEEMLDEDSKRRLHSNPLRVLDSKSESTQAALRDAPSLLDFIGEESTQHFESLKLMLDSVGISYTVNPRLVRGLDYYSRTVFEWVTDKLGAQGTVCAGGRFDSLVEMLGGRATPAVGLAMGVERLIALMQDFNTVAVGEQPDCILILLGDLAQNAGVRIAEELRSSVTELRVVQNHGGGSLKSQMKKADRIGARWAIIIGEEELNQGVASVKPLRGEGEQSSVKLTDLAAYFESAKVSA